MRAASRIATAACSGTWLIGFSNWVSVDEKIDQMRYSYSKRAQLTDSIILFLASASFQPSCSCSASDAISMQTKATEADRLTIVDSEHFDYLVIGYGAAGQASADQIIDKLPMGHRLLIVDPNADWDFLKSNGNSLSPHIVGINSRVAALDPIHRRVTLQNGMIVEFSKCVIAVGATASPIPDQFVDSECVRSFGSRCVDMSSPKAVQDLFNTVAIGGHVTIAGANSWETVDLAGQLAMHAREKVGLKHSVTLLFPAYGPMAGSLPRYLSQAVMRRLISKGVDVVPYAQIRYIGGESSASFSATRPNRMAGAAIYQQLSNYSQQKKQSTTAAVESVSSEESEALVLFTAKSYDSLVTHSFLTDRIAFAPSSVPSLNDVDTTAAADEIKSATTSLQAARSPQGDKTGTSPGLLSVHTHDFLLKSGLEIDRVSGGLLVNPSLEACSGVYAAGDIASVYLNHGNGLRHRGLYRGWDHGIVSGRVAGHNMIVSNTPSSRSEYPLVYNHIPIYEGENAEAGLRFTMVGNCSAALESHGFWWKIENKKTTSRGSSGSYGSSSSNSSARERREIVKSSSTGTAAALPPGGLGVVFYVHAGRIVGVLLSGLPTTVATTSDATYASISSITDAAPVTSDSIPRIASSTTSAAITAAATTDQIVQVQSMQTLARKMLGTLMDDLVEEAALGAMDHKKFSSYAADEFKWSADGVSPLLPYLVSNSPTAIGPPLVISSATDYLSERVLMLHSLTRRAAAVIAPLMSPQLLSPVHIDTTNTTATTTTTTTKEGQHSNGDISLLDIDRVICSYPRPIYKHGLSSRAFLKELTDQSMTGAVRPAVPREAVFQLGNNSGSREDRLAAAYSRGIIQGWSPPGIND